MLNKYQKDTDEFLRVVRIIRAGMSVYEVQDFLNANVYPLSKALNLPYARTRSVVARRIHSHLQHNNPTKPHIDITDLPRVIVCDGCRSISEVEGLRHSAMNRGEPFTWSIDREGMPNSSAPFTDTEIHRWFTAWAMITGNKVVQITKPGEVGICHISFRRIDGPGRVMGFVLQPRGTVEMMAGGNLAADMFIDNSERTYPLARTRRFGKHEAGHCYGLKHDPVIDALMYHLLMGNTDLNPQKPDVAQWKARYIDQRGLAHA